MKIIKCAASEQPANGSAYSRYYIAPGKYYTWKEVGEVLAPILHKKGTVSSPQPKSISFEEAGPLGVIMGSNMLARAPRAESLGYNDEEKSLLDTMKAEL